MKVVISAEARADLEAIADYVAKDSAKAAQELLDRLEARCHQLAEFPRSSPLLARFKSIGVRRAVHGNYLIFYRVGDLTVEVLHVLHCAMDYERILFPSEHDLT